MTAVRESRRGLAAAMTERGYRGRLFVMQSWGGVATAEAMQRYPVRMIESGPAAGALMAGVYGELVGHRDLVAFDMGGTTAKLALIENGRPDTTTAFELHRVDNAPGSGLPVNIQAIDLVEIGAGGGSIARARLGVIALGPESAPSVPVPACYERGRDPRDLTFVAFGGSGPVHGCRLARALGIPRVILPAAAGVTAALGLLAAEVRFDVARSYLRRLDAVDPAQLGRMYAEMTQQAMEVVRESAVGGEITVAHSADARYVGQGYELTVPVPPGELDAPALARVRAAFDELYAARYGYANPSEPVEVVTWKLSAVGGSPRIALAQAPTHEAGPAVKGVSRAYVPQAHGYVDTPVYDRYALAAGARLAGPAIVEERESTTVLPPGASASVDEYANLLVELP